MQRCQRNFGRRNHEEIGIAILEHRVGKLAQLAGRPHRIARHQIRRHDLPRNRSAARSRKNCAIARESRAPGPLRIEKRLPESFAARSKSKMSSASPSSQCGFGREIEFRAACPTDGRRRCRPRPRRREPNRRATLGDVSSSERSGDRGCRAPAVARVFLARSIFVRARRSSGAILARRPLCRRRARSRGKSILFGLGRSTAVSAERYSAS